jgi:hypothetical protein
MRETPLSPFVRIVEFCTRYPWRVLISAAVIAAAAGFYAADRFAITTNVNYLLSSGLPSRDRGGGRRADARAGGAGGGALTARLVGLLGAAWPPLRHADGSPECLLIGEHRK